MPKTVKKYSKRGKKPYSPLKKGVPINPGIPIVKIDILSRRRIRFELIYNRIIDNDAIVHDINLLTVMTPGEIKKYIWGDDNNIQQNMRQIIEPVGAAEQCKKAGVGFDPRSTTCWICGCVIGNEARACEHILPALRAVMFTGMITNNDIGQREAFLPTNEYLQQITRDNYLWAHDNCNGSSGKSGMVLIKFNEHSELFEVDKDKCNALMAKILNVRNGEDCYKRASNQDKPYQDIFDRLAKEMEQKCETINGELEVFKERNPGKPNIQYYMKYVLEVIKLYANAEALQELLTEEEQRILTEERQKEKERLIEENIRLQMEMEKRYNDFIRKEQNAYKSPNRALPKTYSITEPFNPAPIVSFICSETLSIRVIESYDIYVPSTQIVDIRTSITTKINTALEFIFHNIGQFNKVGLTEGFLYDITGFLTKCLAFQEAMERNIPFFNKVGDNIRRRIHNENDFRNVKCNYLWVIIDKIYREFYIHHTSKRDFLRKFLKSPEYIFFKSIFNEMGINTRECAEIIKTEIAKYHLDITQKTSDEDEDVDKIYAQSSLDGNMNTSESLQEFGEQISRSSSSSSKNKSKGGNKTRKIH